MPTNVLRNMQRRAASGPDADTSAEDQQPIVVLTVGRVAPIRLRLAGTHTASLIWRALPLYSVAETWGACIHFEVPVDTGRDRTAKINAAAGEIYFWVEDGRILVPFGATPISRQNEMRLPLPCNVWAHVVDGDITALATVVPGEKVSLVAAEG